MVPMVPRNPATGLEVPRNGFQGLFSRRPEVSWPAKAACGPKYRPGGTAMGRFSVPRLKWSMLLGSPRVSVQHVLTSWLGQATPVMWVSFVQRLSGLRRLWLALFTPLFAIAPPPVTQAANINIINSPGLPPIIVIEGNFEAGDDKKFVQIALPLDQAIVILNSPGGNVLAAIGIGRAI